MIKIRPDKQKAKSLKETAKITLERLKGTNIEKYPSNTLIDYYDVIRMLMEALTLIDGIKVKGEGAHKIIIDYVCKNYGFAESVRMFLQEMRDYRNRISYEGFTIQKNYIKTNLRKIEQIINQLLELVNKKLIW